MSIIIKALDILDYDRHHSSCGGCPLAASIGVTRAIPSARATGWRACDAPNSRHDCQSTWKKEAMTDQTLFEPYTLGSLTLANRVVLAPLTRNRAGAGFVPSEFAA